MATKKKAKPSKPKTKKKSPAKKPTLLFEDEDGDEDEFDFFGHEEAEMEHESSPSLTLGQRLGTITMLETIPAASLPLVAQKAGLEMKLEGSKVCLSEKGQALSLSELKELAEWLLQEAQKASEQYAIDLGE